MAIDRIIRVDMSTGVVTEGKRPRSTPCSAVAP